MLVKIGNIFILILYILSGIKKLFSFNSTVNALKSKFPINMPMIFYKLAIVGVIILLTIGSLFLNYSIFTEKYKKESSYVIILFIAFTIAATLLFHLPTDQAQQIQFLKNLSIIGGFILLLSITSRGIKIF